MDPKRKKARSDADVIFATAVLHFLITTKHSAPSRSLSLDTFLTQSDPRFTTHTQLIHSLPSTRMLNWDWLQTHDAGVSLRKNPDAPLLGCKISGVQGGGGGGRVGLRILTLILCLHPPAGIKEESNGGYERAQWVFFSRTNC